MDDPPESCRGPPCVEVTRRPTLTESKTDVEVDPRAYGDTYDSQLNFFPLRNSKMKQGPGKGRGHGLGDQGAS